VEQTLYTALPQQENYSISYDVKSFADVVAVSNALELRGISAKNASAEVFAFQQSFRDLERLFTVISLLVLFLALFLCAVLLFKLQNSRYREMGLLSALGFRAAYLKRMVRWENLFLSAFSAAVSGGMLALSTVVCRIINFPLAVGTAQVSLCVGGSFVVIIAVSSLASAKLIRTEPAAALKHH
jgi:ABC-type antimicrobial peptide transport system permease subunit